MRRIQSVGMNDGTPNYRPDIDGLRALAVLSVLLFHMGMRQLSGGFVGVDIFFVISGFLLTSIIWRELDGAAFRFGTFFMRRVRRIAPALLVVLFATLAVGHFVLAPLHYQMLGQSSIAAILSVSNILFWSEAGYFDEAAIYKPLLHTWSLGVEEQFYLVWPFLLWLLHRMGRRFSVASLLVLSAISLIAAQWVLQSRPEAAFFLMPFRFFEFGFGAVLALVPASVHNARIRSTLSFVGLVLVLIAVFAYREETTFPGVAAVVPSLGAALLILSGPAAPVNRALALAPVVYVGRISYSLYLVHWPVVVYYSYRFGTPERLFETLLLTVVCMVLASGVYHAVEVPIRARRAGSQGFVMTGRRLIRTVLTSGLVTILLAGAVSTSRGMPWRMPAELRQLADIIDRNMDERLEGIRAFTCQFIPEHSDDYQDNFETCLPAADRNLIVLVGDSHAADLYFALAQSFPDRDFVQLTGDGCSFSRLENMDPLCLGFMEFTQSWITRHANKLDLVIYTQRAAHMMWGDPTAPGATLLPDLQAEERVGERLNFLADQGVDVVFWGPRAEYHPNIRVVVASSRQLDDIPRFYERSGLEPFALLDRRLAAQFEDSAVAYVSTYAAICEDRCPVLLPDQNPLFVDYGHWSPEGGLWVVSRVLQATPELAARMAAPVE